MLQQKNIQTVILLNNTVKNIPIKLKQFFLDSSYKIKYELLPIIKDVVYKEYLIKKLNMNYFLKEILV